MYGIKGKRITNWSGTYSCTPEQYFEPECEEDLLEILDLARTGKKTVRVMGCGQSPSDLPFTNDYLISMKKFDNVLEVNAESCQIKVESGIKLSKLNNDVLPKHNLALRIIGAISDISIGGAVSTGTHNSGINFGTVASYVTELELMTADGNKIKCSREENSELFLATCCGLGAIGIILTVTIQCEKAFNLKQTRYPSTLKEILDNLDVHLKSSDHFRFYWFPHTENVLVDHMSRTKEAATKEVPMGGIRSWLHNYLVGYYMLEFVYWICCFIPSLIPKVNQYFFQYLHNARQSRIDRGDKILNIECLFKQYVNEWAIPIEKTAVALYQLKEWLAKTPGTYAHFPVEVRFVKQEDFYLSPSHGHNSCYINIIMYRPYGRKVPYEMYWDAYEKIMTNVGGRPHWAKAHHVTAQEFRKMYPYFDTWCSLRKKYDSNDRFKNSYMDRILS